MRRLSNPGVDAEQRPKPQIEDIQVMFFEADKSENVAVRRELIEIPANCGKWAKEAMVLGFFLMFDELVAGDRKSAEDVIALAEKMGLASEDEVRKKRIGEAVAELRRFNTLIAGAKGKLKPVQDAEAPQQTQ